MKAFGYLLQNDDLDLEQKSFLGLGFGSGGVTIDIVPFHLMGRLLPDFSLLVVDEFAKFNGDEKSEGVIRLESTLDRLDEIYGETRRLKCSDFMGLSEYQDTLRRVRPIIEDNDEIRNLARKTVPPKYRRGENFLDYPINEVACVLYLYLNGFRLKLGPSREKKYDKLMRVLNVNGRYGLRGFLRDMEFGYTLPAFSLSGREVVPYVPGSRNERILLDDSEEEVNSKLESAPPKTLRYLGMIGFVASNLLGGNYDPEDIQRLERDGLLDLTKHVMNEGIIRPYNGV